VLLPAIWLFWKEFQVNAPIDAQPVVTEGNVSLQVGASIPASSLFSVSDADGDAMTAYQFWDFDAGLNGAPQTPNM
jgi:hypothetical protein